MVYQLNVKVMLRTIQEKLALKDKKRSQILKELSMVSYVVLLVFPQAVTCSDILYFAASMAMSSVFPQVNIEFSFALGVCSVFTIYFAREPGL